MSASEKEFVYAPKKDFDADACFDALSDEMKKRVQAVFDAAEAGLKKAKGIASIGKIAAFDADGTLWGGDLGEKAFNEAAEKGPIKWDVVQEPLVAFADKYGVKLPDDKDAALAKLVEAYEMGHFVHAGRGKGMDDRDILADVYAMQAWIYAGSTVKERREYGERMMEEGLFDRIFPETRALVTGLKKRGFQCIVVSASEREMLKPGARSVGFDDDDVFGMELNSEDGKATTDLVHTTYAKGKVDLMKAVHKVRPLIAFGDSVLGGDRELFEIAPIRVAVRPKSGANREAAEAAKFIILEGE
jgi:phosphoserine phosphatase